MKLGKIRIVLILNFLFLLFFNSSFSLDKVQIVPLINLEDIEATFEEEKNELEKIEEDNVVSTESETEKNISNINTFNLFTSRLTTGPQDVVLSNILLLPAQY